MAREVATNVRCGGRGGGAWVVETLNPELQEEPGSGEAR